MCIRDRVEPKRSGALDVYEMPKKNHIYTMTVDVSRGLTNDYSAFCITDCTSVPYKLVAKYRDNEIKPLVFPSIIERVAKHYNNAFVLVEINDLGQQVADNLQFELEYDNMMMVTQRGRSGQVLGGGFSGRGNQLGLRMTKGTKKIGTSNLKSLIEGDKLIIQDFGIGMDEEELVQNLGTIAHSGSKDFIEALKSDGEKNDALIGKFGVGFYSVFMVADKVQVFTKNWKKDATGYCWESDGSGTYQIEEAEGQRRGAKIIINLK